MSAGILENLCSKAKDPPLAAVSGHCQLFKTRVISYKEMVQFWGEMERIDNKKAARAAAWAKKKRGTTKKLAARAEPGGGGD